MLTPNDLDAIRAVVRSELREHFRRDERRLSREDLSALSMLLPVIAAAVGDRVFAVADLVMHGKCDVGAPVRDALAAAGGPHKVGKLLRRANGCSVAGYRVLRIGEDRSGALWNLCGEDAPMIAADHRIAV